VLQSTAATDALNTGSRLARSVAQAEGPKGDLVPEIDPLAAQVRPGQADAVARQRFAEVAGETERAGPTVADGDAVEAASLQRVV
jgi:hypothetical protein